MEAEARAVSIVGGRILVLGGAAAVVCGGTTYDSRISRFGSHGFCWIGIRVLQFGFFLSFPYPSFVNCLINRVTDV